MRRSLSVPSDNTVWGQTGGFRCRWTGGERDAMWMCTHSFIGENIARSPCVRAEWKFGYVYKRRAGRSKCVCVCVCVCVCDYVRSHSPYRKDPSSHASQRAFLLLHPPVSVEYQHEVMQKNVRTRQLSHCDFRPETHTHTHTHTHTMNMNLL